MKKKDNKKIKAKKKVTRKKVSEGRLYINATFNNTLVTITDLRGEVLSWTSSGKLGFRGTRKSTPFAATSTIENVVKDVADLGIKKIEVYIKGPGPGRDSALRVLRATRNIDVTMVSDVTPIPHNGPRAPKIRRS